MDQRNGDAKTALVARVVFHYRIAPRKVSPADNLPVKIRPALRPPGRDRNSPANCRPGETFLSKGGPRMKRLFYGAGDILIKRRRTKSVIISPRGDILV